MLPAHAPQAQQATYIDENEPQYSKGFINVVRLLSAAAMFSSMFAVLRFDSNTANGRLLIALGVLTAFSGQLFISQASKSEPPAWVQVPITLLGVGLFGIIIAWIMVAS